MIFSGLETEYLVLCGIATTLLMLRSRLKNRLALKDAADILTVSVSSGSVLQALNNIFFMSLYDCAGTIFGLNWQFSSGLDEDRLPIVLFMYWNAVFDPHCHVAFICTLFFRWLPTVTCSQFCHCFHAIQSRLNLIHAPSTI